MKITFSNLPWWVLVWVTVSAGLAWGFLEWFPNTTAEAQSVWAWACWWGWAFGLVTHSLGAAITFTRIWDREEGFYHRTFLRKAWRAEHGGSVVACAMATGVMAIAGWLLSIA
jgi:hypothetical protein